MNVLDLWSVAVTRDNYLLASTWKRQHKRQRNAIGSSYGTSRESVSKVSSEMDFILAFNRTENNMVSFKMKLRKNFKQELQFDRDLSLMLQQGEMFLPKYREALSLTK